MSNLEKLQNQAESLGVVLTDTEGSFQTRFQLSINGAVVYRTAMLVIVEGWLDCMEYVKD